MESFFLQERLAVFSTRLKALRLERLWTLDDLARHSGFSRGYLSRLETGDRQASIASVLTLSRVLGVSLASMFEEENEGPVVIVRDGGAPSYDADGLTCWPLSARSRPMQLQPLRVVVSPDRDGDDRRQHDGEEWVYVLSGELTLLVGAQSHELNPGDAAHFDARLPHRLEARSGLPAELLLVAAPRPGGLPSPRPPLSPARFLSQTPSSSRPAIQQ
jgi:transcriptional regulator with XRE-family HTH domain